MTPSANAPEGNVHLTPPWPVPKARVEVTEPVEPVHRRTPPMEEGPRARKERHSHKYRHRVEQSLASAGPLGRGAFFDEPWTKRCASIAVPSLMAWAKRQASASVDAGSWAAAP